MPPKPPRRPRGLVISSAAPTLTMFALGLAISISACTTSSNAESDDNDLGDTEGAVTSSARSVALKYEGTCDFLRSCSSYSKNVPEGKVTWGCTGLGVCSDSALWVAAPNNSYCGKSVRICNKGKHCTTALVKDISISHDWEASNGVLDDLGLPHGLSAKCAGYGGGDVTLTVGESAGSRSGSDTNSNSNTNTNTNTGADDSGCWSSTLEKDVDELTCVQSRASRVWFQCHHGKWYRGVNESSGPYGDCSSRHPL